MSEHDLPPVEFGRRAYDRWSLTPENEREAILLMAQSVGRIEKMFDSFLGEVKEIKADVDSLKSDRAKVWGAINVIRAVLVPILVTIVGAALVAGFGLKA